MKRSAFGLGAVLGAIALAASIPTTQLMSANAGDQVLQPVSSAPGDLLPDLGMAQLTKIRLDTTSSPGRRLLRFDTVIANVGAGAFEVLGERPDSSRATMTVAQRIFDSTGGYRDVPTDAVMYFAGDGHSHWHVRDLETYTLNRLDNGVVVGTGAKHGFCFFDNVAYRLSLMGAPSSAQYRECGGSADLAVTMGLSVGWGDKYPSTLPDQYIDVTGLKLGKYRLNAAADDSHWFEEQSESNNLTWTVLKLTNNSVRIVRQGPAA